MKATRFCRIASRITVGRLRTVSLILYLLKQCGDIFLLVEVEIDERFDGHFGDDFLVSCVLFLGN